MVNINVRIAIRLYEVEIKTKFLMEELLSRNISKESFQMKIKELFEDCFRNLFEGFQKTSEQKSEFYKRLYSNSKRTK